jgi:EAL domain-containing protein (putative c-di-GMP-specific phosphodiesterase class I)
LLSEHVLNIAIGQLAEWHAESLDRTLAVNLAMRNLEDGDMPVLIAGLLESTVCHRLEIEVTESGLMQSLDKLTDTPLISCRKWGLHCAGRLRNGAELDSYLRDFSADTLKLDRAFLRNDAAADSSSRMLIATAIEGCHRLGFRVIAEGAKDQAAYDLLRELSCDYGQGYFIARPLPNRSSGSGLPIVHSRSSRLDTAPFTNRIDVGYSACAEANCLA